MNPDWEQLWLMQAIESFDRSQRMYRRGLPFDHRTASKGRTPARHNEIAAKRKKDKAAKKSRRQNRSSR